MKTKRWLVTTKRGGQIVVAATSSLEAINTANVRYCDEDDPAIYSFEYQGNVKAINEYENHP